MENDGKGRAAARCWVCDAEVQGEMEVWAQVTGEDVKKLMAARGWICTGCGAALCMTIHKKEVQGAGLLNGYRKSPCPNCGEPLINGFLVVPGEEVPGALVEEGGQGEASHPGDPEAGAQASSGSPMPARWDIQPVAGGKVVVPCPDCGSPHSLDAAVFLASKEEAVPGLSKTDQVVGPVGLVKLFSFLLGAGVFWGVHQVLYGPQIQIGAPLLIPAFAAVITFSLSQPVLALIPRWLGKMTTVYQLPCPGCGGRILFATNGKTQAVPAPEADTR